MSNNSSSPSSRPCFSFTSTRNSWFRRSFSSSGLRPTTTNLGDGTVVHCWAPKNPKSTKPNLVLIHGIGANAMWQWNEFIPSLSSRFNLYVPDLLFFGESYTTRRERSESFQAQCVMRAVEGLIAGGGPENSSKMSLVGLSYGGFVAYQMAAIYEERVERVVIACAGVCMEESDMERGMFQVKSVDEAVEILLARTPKKLRQLMDLSFYRPAKNVPSCFLSDFIDVMNTENFQERKELIYALHKDRKLSDLPKITQPALIIWGEHDKIFPVELAHRLKRHLGDNASLVIIKKAGHAVNMEKPKEFYKHIKPFLTMPVNNNPHDLKCNGSSSSGKDE